MVVSCYFIEYNQLIYIQSSIKLTGKAGQFPSYSDVRRSCQVSLWNLTEIHRAARSPFHVVLVDIAEGRRKLPMFKPEFSTAY